MAHTLRRKTPYMEEDLGIIIRFARILDSFDDYLHYVVIYLCSFLIGEEMRSRYLFIF